MNSKFSFESDGSVTFKTNEIIFDPNRKFVCNEYVCYPITQLRNYSRQMDNQVYYKFIHDKICPIDGIDKYINATMADVKNNELPTTWEQASHLWGASYDYRFVDSIQKACNSYKQKN